MFPGRRYRKCWTAFDSSSRFVVRVSRSGPVKIETGQTLHTGSGLTIRHEEGETGLRPRSPSIVRPNRKISESEEVKHGAVG